MPLTVDFQPVLDAADLFRRADREMQAAMRRAVSREVTPWLASAIRRAGGGMPQDRAIASTARVRTGANPAVVIGSSRRLAGGGTTAELVRVYEFGGYREARETYRARARRGRRHDSGAAGSGGLGATYDVTRHTQRQIPWPVPTGRMVYPAVAEAAPMLVRAWCDVIRETYEGGRG